jgi:hypothetical protein
VPVTFWFYVLALAGGAFVGAWIEHRWDMTRYETLQADFAGYRAQVSAQAAAAQAAARAAVEAESALRQAAEARNAEILSKYQEQKGVADAAARDRDIAQRLLHAAYPAAPAGSGSRPMPAPADRSGTPGAPAAPGDRQPDALAGLTAAAIADCRDAIERLDALQRELKPQL